jgi:head-tail adaptor
MTGPFATRLESVTVSTPGGWVDPVDPGSASAGTSESIMASVLPSSTNERSQVGDRGQVTTTYRLYAPGRQTIITAGARILWQGLALDVVGDPEFWPDPLGSGFHTEATLQLAKG